MTSVDGGSAGTNYRRGVLWRRRRLFAGRGIVLPDLRTTAIVVLSAFVLGVVTGWLTGYIPEMVRADPVVTPSPSEHVGLAPTAEPVLPPMAPINRSLTDADREAGVLTTDIQIKGAGTFAVVPGVDEPVDGAGDVRWVSVSVEDGITADAAAFRSFVMETLNSFKGWGSGGTVQYVATDGVADYRFVLASPYSAAALCPSPHDTIFGNGSAPSDESSPAAVEGDKAPAVTDSPWLCGEEGVAIISSYDWTAGYPAYGADVTGARQYLLNHLVGHLMGRDEVTCTAGRAEVMSMQEAALVPECEVNPWPFPDAVAPESGITPTASGAPSPGA